LSTFCAVEMPENREYAHSAGVPDGLSGGRFRTIAESAQLGSLNRNQHIETIVHARPYPNP
jgi:hypothetical protein